MVRALHIGILAGVIAAVLVGDRASAAPGLPGQPCDTVPPPELNWTEPERWAWTEICEGRVADFNQKLGLEEPLDPRTAEGWDQRRRLGRHFLETILLHEPFRTATPRQGVRISGAWFQAPVDLSNAHIGRRLLLEKSRFERYVNLVSAHASSNLDFNQSSFVGATWMSSLRVEGYLNMTGATVSGSLNMQVLEVGGDLFMRYGAEFAEVILRGAKVGGQLDMTGATVSGSLNMDSFKVGGDLFMRNDAEFAAVNLRGAKVGDQFDMTGATVSGTLDMDALEVDGDLFMRYGAEFAAVNLRGAKVGGQLSMTGATVSGSLDMGSFEVGGSLFMRNGAEFAEVSLLGAKVRGQLDMTGATVSGTLNMSSFEVDDEIIMRDGAEFAEVNLRGAKVGGQLDMTGATVSGTLDMDSFEAGGDLYLRDGGEFAEVDLVFARVGGNLDISGAQLASLDLTGSKLGELRLGSAVHESTRWRDDELLVLRNTAVDAIQDRELPNPWPQNMVLDGFVFQRLGGYASSEADADMAARPASWFVEWLAKDETYSPQPYRQLAGVLRQAGDDAKADAVLYAGRERERGQSQGVTWWGLTLLKYTIGYGLGHRQFWSLAWVAGFVLAGVIVLWGSGAVRDEKKGLFWSVACSLDLLLPIVKLDDSHKEHIQQIGGFGTYYFYAHQLAGWILASFLIAGVSGLTKL